MIREPCEQTRKYEFDFLLGSVAYELMREDGYEIAGRCILAISEMLTECVMSADRQFRLLKSVQTMLNDYVDYWEYQSAFWAVEARLKVVQSEMMRPEMPPWLKSIATWYRTEADPLPCRECGPWYRA